MVLKWTVQTHSKATNKSFFSFCQYGEHKGLVWISFTPEGPPKDGCHLDHLRALWGCQTPPRSYLILPLHQQQSSTSSHLLIRALASISSSRQWPSPWQAPTISANTGTHLPSRLWEPFPQKDVGIHLLRESLASIFVQQGSIPSPQQAPKTLPPQSTGGHLVSRVLAAILSAEAFQSHHGRKHSFLMGEAAHISQASTRGHLLSKHWH